MGYVSSMRGDENQQPAMFSYVNLDRRVRSAPPLRAIRHMADRALAELSAHFDALYARRGRPSIRPEQLIRALAELSDRGGTQRSGVCGQPEETQTGGEGVWLGQAGQRAAQNQVARFASGGLALSFSGHRPQSGADGEVGSCAVSTGSRVSEGQKSAPAETEIVCRTAAKRERSDG